MFYLLTFENTHNAIYTKKILSSLMSIRTVPVLRQISASCGIAIRIEYDDYSKLNNLINENKISNYKLYLINHDKIKLILED